MKLCAGQYKYLLTVYELSKTLKTVRSVDIANSLSVTRPSVSKMLKCMERLELIEPEYATSVIMTDLGKETAKNLSVNFNTINTFFTEIWLQILFTICIRYSPLQSGNCSGDF